MAFNIEAARKDGISDADIANHLAGVHRFNVEAARADGVSDAEIADHLAQKSTTLAAVKNAASDLVADETHKNVMDAPVDATNSKMAAIRSGIRFDDNGYSSVDSRATTIAAARSIAPKADGQRDTMAETSTFIQGSGSPRIADQEAVTRKPEVVMADAVEASGRFVENEKARAEQERIDAENARRASLRVLAATDTPEGENARRILTEQGADVVRAVEQRNYANAHPIIADTATDFRSGVAKVPGAFTGLLDIAPALVVGGRPADQLFDEVGKITGFQPAQYAQELEAGYSDIRKQGQRDITAVWDDETKSWWDVAKEYAANPGVTAGNIIQSLPSMAAGGSIGRATMLSKAGLAPVAMQKAATTAGAIGEGAIMAGQQMNEIDKSVDARTAALASLATGIMGAAVGKYSGALASKFGIRDVDTMLAGGTATTAVTSPFYKRIPAAMVQEGIIEEGTQSSMEQMLKNVAEDKPVMEGVNRATVEGIMAGAVMGGAVAAPGVYQGAAPTVDASAPTLTRASQIAQAGIAPQRVPTGAVNAAEILGMPEQPAVNQAAPTLTRAAQAAAGITQLAQPTGTAAATSSPVQNVAPPIIEPAIQESAPAAQLPEVQNVGATDAPIVAGMDRATDAMPSADAAGGDANGILRHEAGAGAGRDAMPGTAVATDVADQSVPDGVRPDAVADQIKPIVEQLVKLRRNAGQVRLAPQLDIAVNKAKAAIKSGTGKAADFTKLAKAFKGKDAEIHAALLSIADTLKPAQAPKKVQKASSDLMMRIRQLGGIDAAQALDITGEQKAPGGWRFTFKNGGNSLDDLATMLADEGYQIDTGDVDGGVQQLRDMIRAHIGGERNFKASTIEAQAEAMAQSRYSDDLIARAASLGIKWKNLTEAQLDDAIYLAEDDLRMAAIAEQEAMSDAAAEVFGEISAIDDAEIDIPFGDEISADSASIDAYFGYEGKNGESTEGNDRQAEGAAGGGESQGSARTADDTDAAQGGFALEGYTNAEVIRREAAVAKAEEEAAREPEGKKVTTDQADLFNTQGALFNSNRTTVKESLTAQYGAPVVIDIDMPLFHGTRAGNKFSAFDVDGTKNSGVGSNVFNQGNYAYLTQSRDAAQWFADMATENADLRAGKSPSEQPGNVLEFTLKKGAKVLRIESMPQKDSAAELIERAKADGVDAIMFRDPAFDVVEGSKRVFDILNSGQPMDTVLVLNHEMLTETSSAQDGNVKQSARAIGFPKTAPVIADFKSDAEIKAHPDYKEAKAGGIEAAVRMVADLVTPESIAAARAQFGDDVAYLPVMAQEASGKNQIPNALAAHYAEQAGGMMATGIFQTNKAYHTGADAMERLVARSEFGGKVIAGQKYVLVDDVSTMGGTLADMASYIQSQGGVVFGAVLLTNSSRSGSIASDAKTIRSLGERHGQAIAELFGIEPGALTRDEAQYLIGFRTTDELRNRAASAVAERSRRVLSKAQSQPADSASLENQSASENDAASKQSAIAAVKADAELSKSDKLNTIRALNSGDIAPEDVRDVVGKTERTSGIGANAKQSRIDKYLEETPEDRSKLNVDFTFKNEAGEEVRGALHSQIEDKFNQGYRVVLTKSGPAFVNDKMQGMSARDISPAGMRYASWLSINDKADVAETDFGNTEDAPIKQITEAEREEIAQDAVDQANAIEPEQTDDEIKPVTKMQELQGRGQENRIGDFGRKVAVRKDEAKATGKRMAKEADDRPAWARPYMVMQITESALQVNKPNVGKWQVMKKSAKMKGLVAPASRDVFNTEQEALDAIALVEVMRNHRVYTEKTDTLKQYGVFRLLAEGKKRALVKGGFASMEEAANYLYQNPTEIIEHKFEFPDRPWLDKIERIGADRRNGKPVTKQMFIDTFAPGGVVYGNWLLNSDETVNDDGQDLSNHAYDALLDLAETLNIPPKALFLNGDMVLGLGADGKGGKDSGAAHYSPGKGLINLTKINGAGSLAHEWWHAVDHYFAKSSGYSDSTSVVSGGYLNSRSDARPELREAVKQVVNTMLYAEKSQTTDADLVRKNAQKRMDDAISTLDYKLNDLRRTLVSPWKSGKKPATAAQLKQWDELAAKLRDGDMGEQVYIENPSKSRYAMGFKIGTHIRDMNALYKSVGGSSFLRQDPQSAGRQLAWPVEAIKDNKEKLNAKDDVTTTYQGRTEFYIEAKDIDNYRSSSYWSTPWEMGARAFESYIFDKLTAGKQQSDYLVYGVENRYYAALGMKPYPEGSEREAINAAFDNLFNVIETKETDQGIALYEPRAKYLAEQGAQAYAAPYDYLETRPDTKPAQLDAGRGALESVEQRIFGRNRTALPVRASVLGSAVAQGFRDQGYVSLVGQPVESSRDLAVVAQVLRDPRFETFRAVFIKDGKVVGERAYSSRMAGSVAMPNDIAELIGADMGRTQADGYWLLHNHPSGRAKASTSDLRLTEHVGETAQGMLGHVIIDHNEYNVITIAQGGLSSRAVEEVIEADLGAMSDYPEVPHKLLGQSINAPSDMAAIAKSLQKDGVYSSIVGRAADGSVSMVLDVPQMEAKGGMQRLRVAAMIRRAARETGTIEVFAVVPGELNDYPHLLNDNGIFRDVISSKDGQSAVEQGMMHSTAIKESKAQGRGALRYLAEPAWHGSPHDHDKFDSSKIGTGEGAQAYGYGLYFAGNKEVAEWYKNNLSDAEYKLDGTLIEDLYDTAREQFGDVPGAFIEYAVDNGFRDAIQLARVYANDPSERRFYGDKAVENATDKEMQQAILLLQKIERQSTGRLYQVELAPAEDEYLLWDKPLSEQSEKVKAALTNAPKAHGMMKVIGRNDAKGEEIYKHFSYLSESDKAASDYLHSIGIRGIKYLDSSSRNASRPAYRGDSAYIAAAQDFKESGYSLSDALEGMKQAYKKADHKELQAALNEAYDVQPELNFNYVIFNDEDVSIAAKFSRASRSARTTGQTVSSVKQATQALRNRWLGFRKIEILQHESDLPQEFRDRVLRSGGELNSEGWFDPKTKTVYLVADNLASPERAVWVAAHEVSGHGGVRMLDRSVAEALDFTGKNGFVKKLAQAIADDRGETFNAKAHTDEALAELAAATITGETDAILTRYGVKVPAGMRSNLIGMVKRVVDAVRAFMAKVLGSKPESVTDAEVYGLLRQMREAVEGKPDTDAQADSGYALASRAPAQEKQIPRLLRMAKKSSMERDTSLADKIMSIPFKLVGWNRIVEPAINRLMERAGEFVPEKVKAGLVSDYGLGEEYIDRKAEMKAAEASMSRKSAGLVESLAALTRAESRIAYQWMQTKPDAAIEQAMLEQLPEESRATLATIKQLISDMGKEAVRLGQMSPEAYERNNMAYLHRTYAKHVLNPQGAVSKMLRARALRIKGNQYKGRGIFDEVAMSAIGGSEGFGRKLQQGQADKSLVGEKVTRFERRDDSTDAMDALPGMEKKPMGKLRQVIYWPASEPVPAKFGDWVNAGTFEVRGTKGDKLVVWRDFTKDERERMGELDEVRYAVAQTLQMMVHDIEVGRFFAWTAKTYGKAKAEGREVVASESMLRSYGLDEWVQVPASNIPGTQAKKYGALAGLYVPGAVWNDIRQTAGTRIEPFGHAHEVALQFWKKAKTAWSPAVHMNNVMANFVIADWHDLRAADLAEALKVWANNGKDGYREIYQRFEDSGALGGMFLSNEALRDEIAKQLEAMKAELTGEQEAKDEMTRMAKVMHLVTQAGMVPVKGAKLYTGKMEDAYQFEDAIFRLAAFVKAIRYGKSDIEAGRIARHSFLNYDINAPWIQAARHTMLPFVSFFYRALPMAINTAKSKPWKVIKLMAFWHLISMLGYLGSDGDEEEERALLPKEKQGSVWGVVPKMVRMPWNNEATFMGIVGLDDTRRDGHPVFLDIRRWVPVGDVADMEMGSGILPPWATPGGVIPLLAEVMLMNKSVFTEKEIVQETDTAGEKLEKRLDHLFKGFMPNVPLPNPLNLQTPTGEINPLGLSQGSGQSYAWSGIEKSMLKREGSIGEVKSTPAALASSIGIKVAAYPAKNMQASKQIELRKKADEIKDSMRKIQRNYSNLEEPTPQEETRYELDIERQREKLIELTEQE